MFCDGVKDIINILFIYFVIKIFFCLWADERPEIYYQVGATPEFIENARCGKEPECLNRIDEVCASVVCVTCVVSCGSCLVG